VQNLFVACSRIYVKLIPKLPEFARIKKRVEIFPRFKGFRIFNSRLALLVGKCDFHGVFFGLRRGGCPLAWLVISQSIEMLLSHKLCGRIGGGTHSDPHFGVDVAIVFAADHLPTLLEFAHFNVCLVDIVANSDFRPSGHCRFSCHFRVSFFRFARRCALLRKHHNPIRFAWQAIFETFLNLFSKHAKTPIKTAHFCAKKIREINHGWGKSTFSGHVRRDLPGNAVNHPALLGWYGGGPVRIKSAIRFWSHPLRMVANTASLHPSSTN
jgi:hypothetical protein